MLSFVLKDRKKVRLTDMRVFPLAAVLFLTLPLCAQKKSKDNLSGYDKSARATVAHDTLVYVDPDDTTQKVAEVTPGHEFVVIQRNGPWLKVFANTDTPDQADPDHEPEVIADEVPTPESGWIKDKGVITKDTPNGDAILYGLAANFEDLAEQPHAPKGAAEAAHLLYRRVVEYFPASKLAPEAAWRAADIRWQLDKAANSTLPSTKEQEAYLRPQLYDGEMRRIQKNYPNSKFAALAAWDMLDNKLCGDWQGLPKCPEMEATLYMKYVDQWRESPKAAEAQYNAVYRMGVLVTMYKVSDDNKRAQSAADRCQSLAADMQTRFPDSDFTHRAESIAYRVKQGIAIYGTDRD
jgi:outer membrane protein assembly factor BamD (BamD/ComL family)